MTVPLKLYKDILNVFDFSYRCIKRSLEESNRCPKCNSVIERKDQIFPNVTRKKKYFLT